MSAARQYQQNMTTTYSCFSKAWLRRIQGQRQEQNADSVAETRVAERYVLACVVANG